MFPTLPTSTLSLIALITSTLLISPTSTLSLITHRLPTSIHPSASLYSPVPLLLPCTDRSTTPSIGHPSL